jgi:hypothetical protein
MFNPMIKITSKYLDLALECETVLIVTYLHPAWHVKFFTNCFAGHLERVL